ncbi:hypothetical protein F4809DRAFT_625313 [Biscogniauxia mediterranea]|nr:hypothetical protein F4809DRAFT_625313 [Biscogniauxia mediterranea]
MDCASLMPFFSSLVRSILICLASVSRGRYILTQPTNLTWTAGGNYLRSAMRSWVAWIGCISLKIELGQAVRVGPVIIA